MMNRILLSLLSAALLIAGCSSSKKTTDNETPPYYLGAFEDFDDEAYEDVTPPIEAATPEHNIPAKLEKRAPVGLSMVRGFRVQLFSSLSRPEANEAMQKAISWWEERADGATGRPPIYMEYEQPYYKVRAGNFRNRGAASAMADRLERTFSGAFVVPSMIESR